MRILKRGDKDKLSENISLMLHRWFQRVKESEGRHVPSQSQECNLGCQSGGSVGIRALDHRGGSTLALLPTLAFLTDSSCSAGFLGVCECVSQMCLIPFLILSCLLWNVTQNSDVQCINHSCMTFLSVELQPHFIVHGE